VIANREAAIGLVTVQRGESNQRASAAPIRTEQEGRPAREQLACLSIQPKKVEVRWYVEM
jgi:hypothetical protein